jgi:SAM-dependent methyltransferase
MSSQSTSPLRFSDYTIITELPGDRITGEAMRMLHTRYEFARSRCEAKDLLELGCGPALGLAYLARHARRAVGGDCTFSVLRDASTRLAGKLPLYCLDAHHLPFAEQTFDVILFFEALYYLTSPEQFLKECIRVLKPGGEVLVSLPNCNWPGFNASPYSTRYFSAAELHDLFRQQGFTVEVYGAFASQPSTMAQLVRDQVRRLAVRAHLIPKTFKAKEKFKRFFYGRLQTIESEFDRQISMDRLLPIAPGDDRPEYRVLYALGKSTP